jgi:hypothetical protein
MMRRFAVLAACLGVCACQTMDAASFDVDRDCLQKRAGSRILAKVSGAGLGLAGVPGSGLVGRGVSLATDPRCQALRPRTGRN